MGCYYNGPKNVMKISEVFLVSLLTLYLAEHTVNAALLDAGTSSK